MEIQNSSQWGHWVGGVSQYTKKIINRKTYLSAYWVDGKRKDVTADNMSAELKFAATALYYLYLEVITV